jgi:hypothetical protein
MKALRESLNSFLEHFKSLVYIKFRNISAHQYFGTTLIKKWEITLSFWAKMGLNPQISKIQITDSK